MIQEVVEKLETNEWRQSDLDASAALRLYGEDLNIKKNIIYEAQLAFLDLKIKHRENITSNHSLAAVCLILAAKKNNSPVNPNTIIEFYRQKRHRINKSVANRIMLDLGLKNPVIKPGVLVDSNVIKLKRSEEVKNRITQRELNNDKYFNALSKVAKVYLEYLDLSYRGGSPPSILAVYGIYIADKILLDYYRKGHIDQRSVLSKKIVSRYTGAKIDRCSSQLIAKMNKCLEDNIDQIKANTKGILSLIK